MRNSIDLRINPEKEDADLYIRGISRELRTRFHLFCRERNWSMSRLVQQFMLDCVTGVQTTIEPPKRKKIKPIGTHRTKHGRRKKFKDHPRNKP